MMPNSDGHHRAVAYTQRIAYSRCARCSCDTMDLQRNVGRRQQAIEFFFYYRITFASARFQADAIEHRDMPAAVSDEAGVLQIARRFRNALAPHAEHVC